MTPDQFARVTALSALLLLLSGSVFGRYRGRLSDAFRAVVIWVTMIIALMAIYTYRFELETVVSRVLGEAAPGMTRVTEPGEVMVTRGGTGGFRARRRSERGFHAFHLRYRRGCGGDHHG